MILGTPGSCHPPLCSDGLEDMFISVSQSRSRRRPHPFPASFLVLFATPDVDIRSSRHGRDQRNLFPTLRASPHFALPSSPDSRHPPSPYRLLGLCPPPCSLPANHDAALTFFSQLSGRDSFRSQSLKLDIDILQRLQLLGTPMLYASDVIGLFLSGGLTRIFSLAGLWTSTSTIP